MSPAAVRVGELLRKVDWNLSVAESCTGGLLGGEISAVPGSSEYFLGGVIAYSNEVKTKLLDVPRALLEEHGAVSRQTALAMALGARKVLGSDVALSITGVAGPGGGSSEKPVGLVIFGLVSPLESYLGEVRFEGTRAEVRRGSVDHALKLLELCLTGGLQAWAQQGP